MFWVNDSLQNGVVEAPFGCESGLGHRSRRVASTVVISSSVCDEGDRSDCGMVRSELVVDVVEFISKRCEDYEC